MFKNKVFWVFLAVLLITGMIPVFLSVSSLQSAHAETFSATCTMEVKSGRMLSAKNEHQKMYPASTTKILTAITVLENTDVNSVVKVGKETVGVEGSSIYLEEGEEITVKELLYGLMLRSGNDAAETLAVYSSGSIAEFAEKMNETAKRIGATESHFVNPHGLHDDDHYTTASDLAKISAYAMKNPLFREIVKTEKITVSWSTREYPRVLLNKNKMLSRYDGATGIKTGYTKKAGRCLVSSAIRNNMEVVSVVLNCPDMWEQSEKLLDSAFSDYRVVPILRKDDVVDFADIEGLSDEKCALQIKDDVCIPLKKGERRNLKIEYSLPKTLVRPFEKDEEVGEIRIYLENDLLFREKVYTIIGK